MTTSEMIQKLIEEKSTATPQDIALCLSTHKQMIDDIGTLEALKKITDFADIRLVCPHGSIHFFNFRADWSCDSAGYGYRGIVQDIRKGFSAGCFHPEWKLRLCSRVST